MLLEKVSCVKSICVGPWVTISHIYIYKKATVPVMKPQVYIYFVMGARVVIHWFGGEYIGWLERGKSSYVIEGPNLSGTVDLPDVRAGFCRADNNLIYFILTTLNCEPQSVLSTTTLYIIHYT